LAKRSRAEYDPYKLSNPRVYLWRMTLFLGISLVLALVLRNVIFDAFKHNPGLNGTILAVLLIGILLSYRQVIRIYPEVRWVNTFRIAEPGVEVDKAPILLAPMAMLLGDRIGRTAISTQTMRSLLDSILMRLDEDRDISRYLTGLLVFLGLLGTFWGLLQTVSAVGDTIQALNIGGGEASSVFANLKQGLAAPLSGMGTAFSSSLFGLAGSLILGFLDLQAGQAQSMFYNDLEDWLSTVTDLDPAIIDSHAGGTSAEDLRIAIERLSRAIQDGGAGSGDAAGSGTRGIAAMSNLAEGIQGLVQHMRGEQQMIRSWVEAQAAQQKELSDLMKELQRSLKAPAAE
jgi:CRISPR/Cas system CSM-associated protein Csm2 small subunit